MTNGSATLVGSRTPANAPHGALRARRLVDLDFSDELRKLTAGRSLLIVDDCLTTCEHLKERLEPYFPKRIAIQTNSNIALEDICTSVKKGEKLMLVLDLDIPELSGRQLIFQLARREIFVPFVIHSGGQGNEEMRAFVAQISAATSISELKALVARADKQPDCMPFLYVAKEQAAIWPQLLPKTLGALLLSGNYQEQALRLLRQASRVPSVGLPPVHELDRCFARISDECLVYVSRHRAFGQRFTEALQGIKGEADKKVRELVEWFCNQCPCPEDCAFASLRLKTAPDEFEHFRHSVMGSRGLQNTFGIAEELRALAEDHNLPEFLRLSSEFILIAEAFVERFRAIEDNIWAAFVPPVDVGEVAKAVSDKAGIACQISGTLALKISKTRLTSIFEEAMSNASRSIGGTHSDITVNLSHQPFGELKPEQAKHFMARGYKSVACISISDNGSGIPIEILSAWTKRLPFKSTRSDRDAEGLNLMRRSVESSSDGLMTIASSARGTSISFLFGSHQEVREKPTG